MKTKNFNLKGFKLIAQSTQQDLVEYLTEVIPNVYGKENTECTSDYIFAKGTIPVMLICHLDTVHTEVPSQIYFDESKGVMWSPQGIGGDDRCGVYSIFYIINYLKDNKPYVLFTTDEECGGLGAKVAVNKIKDKVKNVKFLIELDRKSHKDSVFYGCSNDEFEEFINGFGFTTAHGSYSDISTLAPQWGKACVNLSCGYYNAHTKQEYVNVDHMFDTIEKVIKILQQTDLKHYKYSETKNNTNYSNKDGTFDYELYDSLIGGKYSQYDDEYIDYMGNSYNYNDDLDGLIYDTFSK